MILTWMAYALVVATLLTAAAHLAERALRVRSLPTRGVWLGAMVASAALAGWAWWHPVPAPIGLDPLTTGTVVIDPGRWLAAFNVVETDPTWSWGAMVSVAWALASGTLGLALLWATRRLRRERRTWSPARVDGIPVRVSSRFGPAVVGWFPATVVLPAWVLGLEATRRALVIRHETEHVRRHDAEFLLVALVAAIAMPWNLPLWWMLRRLRDAIEVDCDRRVLRGSTLRAYSDLLLDVANVSQSGPRLAPGLTNPKSLLARRITVLTSPRPRAPWTRTTLAAAAATLLVALACDTSMPAAVAFDDDGTTTVGQVLTADQVDRKPERLSGPVPRYPEMLRQAGVEGLVRLSYTVDAEGRVDPSTIEVMQSTNRAFEAPAIDVVGRSHYEPAQLDGRAVPVRVEQQVGFTIQRPGSTEPRRQITRQAMPRLGDSVIVYVDGVLVTEDDMAQMDPDRIARIEILKGVAAERLTGAASSPGVIQITTKAMEDIAITGRPGN